MLNFKQEDIIKKMSALSKPVAHASMQGQLVKLVKFAHVASSLATHPGYPGCSWAAVAITNVCVVVVVQQGCELNTKTKIRLSGIIHIA